MADTQTDQQDQQEEARKDAQGVEIRMTANIPEEQEGWENVELDQTAKHNDLGEGHHKNSTTFGKVVSHYAPDAAGTTPQDLHERAEARMGHTEEETQQKEEQAEASVQQMEETKERVSSARQERQEKSEPKRKQSKSS